MVSNRHPIIPILIDTREQRPLCFDGLDCIVERDTVPIFDYALKGDENNFAVERKSVDDLVNSITTTEGQRLERNKIKKAQFSPIIYVIEGRLMDLTPLHTCSCMGKRNTNACQECHGDGDVKCRCFKVRANPVCEYCQGFGLVGYNYDRRRISPQFAFRQVVIMLMEWGVSPLFADSRLGAACMIESILRRRFNATTL